MAFCYCSSNTELKLLVYRQALSVLPEQTSAVFIDLISTKFVLLLLFDEFLLTKIYEFQ